SDRKKWKNCSTRTRIAVDSVAQKGWTTRGQFESSRSQHWSMPNHSMRDTRIDSRGAQIRCKVDKPAAVQFSRSEQLDGEDGVNRHRGVATTRTVIAARQQPRSLTWILFARAPISFCCGHGFA